MTNDQWIHRIRCGDEQAAEEMIRNYYPLILRYCRRHCPDQDRAEDLTQETFLRLFRNLPQYQERQSFRAYLYTIAHHLCVDESRKLPLYLFDEIEQSGECGELSRIENRDEIDRLLRILSPEQREAVLLRFEEQLNYTEIAKIVGCNLRTAQSRVRNALKLMRNKLSQTHGKEA